MTEHLHVTPVPSPDVLEDVARSAGLTVKVERGEDARGQPRARLTLTHDDPEVLEHARNVLLAFLSGAGYRAFVV